MAYYNLTFKPDCGLPQNSYRSATKREYTYSFLMPFFSKNAYKKGTKPVFYALFALHFIEKGHIYFSIPQRLCFRTFLRNKLVFVDALVALCNCSVGKVDELLLGIDLLFSSEIKFVISAVSRKE